MPTELEQIIAEYERLGIGRQIDYDKLYLYSVITHSTAIEGSTVTEVENQLLFDEGISPDRPLVEQLMNLDLKAAYERAYGLAEKRGEISVGTLRELSGLVMKNTGGPYSAMAGSFDSSAGDLRLLNVSAGRGGRSYLAWQKVEGALEEFCAWLNAERKTMRDLPIDAGYGLMERPSATNKELAALLGVSDRTVSACPRVLATSASRCRPGCRAAGC